MGVLHLLSETPGHVLQHFMDISSHNSQQYKQLYALQSTSFRSIAGLRLYNR